MASSQKSKVTPSDEALMRTFNFQIQKSDRRKFEIISATAELISEQGIEAASLEAIGKKAGLERSHLIYYFKSKDEIFESVMDYVTNTGQSSTTATLKEQNLAIESYVTATFDWVSNFPTQAKVMTLFFHYCTFNKKYADLHQKILRVAHSRIAAILTGHYKREKIRENSDRIHEMARAIHCLLFGYYVELITSSQKGPGPRLREEALRAVHRLAGLS